MRHPSTADGFTLVELLVVIVIIGILSAIAVPSLLAQATRARVTRALTDVSTINRAQLAYLAENGEFAAGLADLASGVPAATTDFNYSSVGEATQAITIADPTSGATNGVAGRVFYQTNSNGALESFSVVCTGAPGEVPDVTNVENETDCP